MDFLLALPASIIVFTLGASIGSFLNVVIYRLPAGVSLLHPPSRCPRCLTPLKKRENVPVLGWIWLKGRCSYCKSSISIRYPLVEAAAGILFLLVFWGFDFSIQTLGYWVFVSWLLTLALIDLDTLTLPNSLTQSGLVLGLGFQVAVGLAATSSPTSAIQHLMGGILGAILGVWLLDLISFAGAIALGQAAMGAGDAKLAAMMGAWLGWKLLLIAGFLACVLGAFVGGGAIAIGRLNRRQPMPFGPFLALGAVLSAFYGEALLSGYLTLFFPTL